MAQTTSNWLPPTSAQMALNNMRNSNLGSSLGQLQQKNASIARLANPSLQVTPTGQIATKPVGVGPVANASQYGALVDPKNLALAKPQPLAQNTNLPTGGTAGQGTSALGYDPKAAPGTAGSLDPSVYNPDGTLKAQPTTGGSTTGTTGGTTAGATGTPYSETNPPTSQSGLIGSALGQAQSYYNQQQGLTTQAQDVQRQIAEMQARIGQEQAATTGQYNGTAQDEAGRIAQLEQIKQSTGAQMGQQAALIQQQQATQAGYESPLTSTYGTAIGAAAPSVVGYGQTTFNPLTQSFGGGASGGGAGVSPSDPFYATLQSYAQMAANGQMSAIPSSVTSNSVLNAQMNDMAKKINPNYNPVVSSAQSATTASNVQTGGTAATQAAASGLQQSTQAYVSANTAYATAQNQSGNLQQTMAATGINTNPQFLNSKINSLQNQFGSAKYTAFITALNETKQAYTNLLASVGASTPTVNGQQATDIFGENSTPAQINSAIDALNQAAYAKLKPMYDQIGTYASQLGGGSTSGSSTGSSSGAFSDSSFYGNK